MRRVACVCACVLTLLWSDVLSADVRTDQKVKFQLGGVLGKVVNMFGGRAAREGVTSVVAVKGNRKATLSDATGSDAWTDGSASRLRCGTPPTPSSSTSATARVA